jgi:hypothetical protein
MTRPKHRRWLKHGLSPCALLVVALSIAGCNASAPNDASAPAKAYTQADLETDLADAAEITRIVAASVAEENFPSPIATSIQRPKLDEAVATIEYGPEPTQKKELTLKKRDGQWTIQRP